MLLKQQANNEKLINRILRGDYFFPLKSTTTTKKFLNLFLWTCKSSSVSAFKIIYLFPIEREKKR